jgi:hypothetical protein
MCVSIYLLRPAAVMSGAQADMQAAGTSAESMMEDASRTIQKAFTLCMTDRYAVIPQISLV